MHHLCTWHAFRLKGKENPFNKRVSVYWRLFMHLEIFLRVWESLLRLVVARYNENLNHCSLLLPSCRNLMAIILFFLTFCLKNINNITFMNSSYIPSSLHHLRLPYFCVSCEYKFRFCLSSLFKRDYLNAHKRKRKSWRDCELNSRWE